MVAYKVFSSKFDCIPQLLGIGTFILNIGAVCPEHLLQGVPDGNEELLIIEGL